MRTIVPTKNAHTHTHAHTPFLASNEHTNTHKIGDICGEDGRIDGVIYLHKKPHPGQSNETGRPEIRGRGQ